MRTCPCINCLVFPICKNKVNEYNNGLRSYEHEVIHTPDLSLEYNHLYQIKLRPKCSILTNWIEKKSDIKKRSIIVDLVHNLFIEERR